MRIGVLDGLRAVAIVLVVATHAFPQALGGVFGVELFFFISGFVLFYGPLSLGTFIGRRFWKIVPSYVLAGAACIALGAVVLGPLDVLAHLTFLADWFHDPDYNHTINGDFWSLCVEVQFYVLFPIIARIFNRAPTLTYLGMILIANVWTAGCMSFNHWGDIAQMPGFLDTFGAGMLTAWFYKNCTARSSPVYSILALAGAVWVGCLLYNYSTSTHQFGWPYAWKANHRTEMSVAFMLTTLSALWSTENFKRLFSNPLTIFIAAISYNLYLWHHLLIAYFGLWGIPAAVLVAAAVTYGFERPIINLYKRREVLPSIAP